MSSQIANAPQPDFVGSTVVAISKLIRNTDLKPGDRLPPEATLSRDLHVSRTVVREALRSLAALRLVELGAGKRPTVAELDDDSFSLTIEHGVFTEQIDIQQIYDVRRTIEARTAALAALRRSDFESRTILAHARAMEADFAQPEKVMEHDIAFHLAVAKASRNPVFVLIIGAFQGVTRQTWPIGWKSRAAEDSRDMNTLHMKLAEAIAAGDPSAATELMNRHFDESVKALLKAGLV